MKYNKYNFFHKNVILYGIQTANTKKNQFYALYRVKYRIE